MDTSRIADAETRIEELEEERLKLAVAVAGKVESPQVTGDGFSCPFCGARNGIATFTTPHRTGCAYVLAKRVLQESGS